MELSATKKKKRKTRKCLNEIRKRSRHVMLGGSVGQQQEYERHRAMKAPPHDRLITKNRLSLNMFTKAVRSETITRPLLEQIKQQSNINENFNDIAPDNNFIPMAKTPAIECFQQSNSTTPNKSMIMFSSDGQILDNSINENNISLGNINYINSPHLNELEQLPKFGVQELFSNTSVMSHTSEGDDGNAFYDEFMDDLLSSFEISTSSFVKEDVLQSTKIKLHKLRIMHLNEHNKQSDLIIKERSSKALIPTSSHKDMIDQNALDYLKNFKCETTMSDWQHSPLPPKVWPLQHESSPSPLGMCEANDLVNFATPEYNYYPHKLNN